MSMGPSSIPPSRGLRLLSLDGGGLRALSQAKIIQETMDRIAYGHSVVESDASCPTPRVADYFDMICGSGFGGLLAIMAGILGMTGKELVDEFTTLCLAVFSGGDSLSEKTTRLELEIKRMVNKYSPPEQGANRMMISDASPCKVFVCAASPENMSSPRLLRNYSVRSNASPDCKVWEAAMATCALLGIFGSITIYSAPIGERFVGGDVRWSNPTHQLTVEVANIFTGHDVACIVSVGSGHPRIISLAEDDNDLFRRIAEDCEQLANDLFRRFGQVRDFYWRLSVEQGMQDINPTDIQDLTKVLAFTRSYLQASRPSNDVDEMIRVIAAAKGRICATVVAGQISAGAETVYLKDCPAPTLHFVGQKKHVTKLRTYFSNKAYRFHIAVLSGLGGAGKTQCGLMFVQLSLDENLFTEVFFLDASDQVSLETGFKSIAQAKGVGESCQDGLRYLERRSDEWLLLLDNADDLKLDLGQYIHRRHGNVLITTRNPHVGDLAPDCHCQIGRLDQADAKELLLRGVNVPESVDESKYAVEIVELLGCHALAVNQARAFLAKGTCSLSNYLQLYKDNSERLLRDHPAQSQSTDDYKYTVYTAWHISFDCLSEMAKTFLYIICFMNHEGIPLFIFHRAYESLSELGTDDRDASVPISLTSFLRTFTAESTWDELRFLQLIEEVRSFSLIEFDSLHQNISLHPLVQQWTQHCSRAVDGIIRTSQIILALATPTGKGTAEYFARKSLLLHFRQSMKSGSQLHHSFLSRAGETLLDGGLYAEASSVFERELEVKRHILGSEHPDTLTSMQNLARAYFMLARHVDVALMLQEEVVKQRRQINGSDNPETLMSMNTLASIYASLERHADALKLNQEVMELRRRILGSEHPDTLITMNNLAVTYSNLDRHFDALKLRKEGVKLFRRILGSEHPRSLASMNNLALTYSALSQHGKALKLKEEVVELRRRILGSEHPDSLASMHNLAITHAALRNYAEAVQLQQEVVELSKQALNSDHPYMAMYTENLRLYSEKLHSRKRDRLKKFLGLR